MDMARFYNICELLSHGQNFFGCTECNLVGYNFEQLLNFFPLSKVKRNVNTNGKGYTAHPR